jgi:hypothetical protein
LIEADSLIIEWDVKVSYNSFTNYWEWSAVGQEYSRIRDESGKAHRVMSVPEEKLLTKKQAGESASRYLKLTTSNIISDLRHEGSQEDYNFKVVYPYP